MKRRWLWTLVVPIAALRAMACSSSPSGPDGGDAKSEAPGPIQPAPQQGLRWAKELGHAAFVRDVGVDGQGNIWIGGRFGAPSLDLGTQSVACAATHCAFVAKLSPTGDVLLAETIGQGDSDVAALSVTPSAVFAALDQTTQADAGPLASSLHPILELDLQGQLVDARTTHAQPLDVGSRATELVGDPADGLYYFTELAGSTTLRVGTLDGSIADFDAGTDGVLVRTFGAGVFEWGSSMGATPNELSTSRGAPGVLVTGQFPTSTIVSDPPAIGSLLFDGGRQRGFLAHVDSNGTPAYLDDLATAKPHGAAALGSGHVVVVGEVKGPLVIGATAFADAGSSNNSAAFWLEVDSSGTPVRATTFGTSVYGVLESVVATGDGGTFATGSGILYTSQGRVEGDGLVVRFDAQGGVMWSRGGFNNLARRLRVVDTPSGPVVVGSTIGALDLSPILTDTRDGGDAAIFIAALQP